MSDLKVTSLVVPDHFEEAEVVGRHSVCKLTVSLLVLILLKRIFKGNFSTIVSLDEDTCVRFKLLLHSIPVPTLIVKEAM